MALTPEGQRLFELALLRNKVAQLLDRMTVIRSIQYEMSEEHQRSSADAVLDHLRWRIEEIVQTMKRYTDTEGQQ